jgi:uncharacterized membrane protein YsdA (DUF1294 family)
MKRHPVFSFAVLTFGLALIAAGLLWGLRPALNVPWAWLIAINVVTLLTFGYDKAIAGSRRMRVPENVLLALTFCGGTIGALVAMPLFRHKTAKRRFRGSFWIVVLIQVALIAAYWFLLGPGRAG